MMCIYCRNKADVTYTADCCGHTASVCERCSELIEPLLSVLVEMPCQHCGKPITKDNVTRERISEDAR